MIVGGRLLDRPSFGSALSMAVWTELVQYSTCHSVPLKLGRLSAMWFTSTSGHLQYVRHTFVESDYHFKSSDTASCDNTAVFIDNVGHVLPISCGPEFEATHSVLCKHAITLTGQALTRCIERHAWLEQPQISTLPGEALHLAWPIGSTWDELEVWHIRSCRGVLDRQDRYPTQ